MSKNFSNVHPNIQDNITKHAKYYQENKKYIVLTRKTVSGGFMN